MSLKNSNETRRTKEVNFACSILSSVASPALQFSSILSHKRQDFRKNVTEYKMFVLIFSLQLLSETFLIIRKTE